MYGTCGRTDNKADFDFDYYGLWTDNLTQSDGLKLKQLKV